MSKLSPDQWQALSPRLDEALGMTDEARATWFSTLRAENPTLARQLEILLQEHRVLSEEGFLDEQPVELPAAPGWPHFRRLHSGFAGRPWRNGHRLAGGTKRRAV